MFDLPAYRFQALITNLPSSEADALTVWRRYNGRADIENHIKELGRQFGIKGLCYQNFRATEAACHLAITAYNLCVLYTDVPALALHDEMAKVPWLDNSQRHSLKVAGID